MAKKGQSGVKGGGGTYRVAAAQTIGPEVVGLVPGSLTNTRTTLAPHRTARRRCCSSQRTRRRRRRRRAT